MGHLRRNQSFATLETQRTVRGSALRSPSTHGSKGARLSLLHGLQRLRLLAALIRYYFRATFKFPYFLAQAMDSWSEVHLWPSAALTLAGSCCRLKCYSCCACPLAVAGSRYAGKTPRPRRTWTRCCGPCAAQQCLRKADWAELEFMAVSRSTPASLCAIAAFCIAAI